MNEQHQDRPDHGPGRAVAPDIADDAATTRVTEDIVEAIQRADQVRTGVPRVDDVIEQLAGLDDRPLSEHAAVFEEAHDRLRRTLDDPGADVAEDAADPADPVDRRNDGA